MQKNFDLFGPAHLAMLGATVALPWLLRRWDARRWFGGFLLGNELIWYAFRIAKGWVSFPHGLPLQLCDLTLWMTVVALLARPQWAFEFAFFTGIAGAGMALATPDLWEPFPSYPTVYFFLAHGGVVAGLLHAWWSGLMRPRPGCVWRVMAVTNAYAVAIGVFNWLTGANYMYLCRKPESASLLDWLGPWPVYILSGEGIALALFTLLWLPFRGKKTDGVG